MNASDFTDNSLTGIATVMNGRAIITKTLASDFTPEGDESFTFNIKTSAGGPIIATSAPIVVADTSVPTVTPSATILTEGSPVTFNLSSNQLSSTLYWTLNPISGSITTSDFVGLATTGSFTTNGTGVGSTTLTLANDVTTEGTESFQLEVRTGSTSGSIIATSATVVVLDTSLLPPPSATVTPSTSSVNEGSSVTFTVNTTNFSSGTLYWTLSTISGTINTSDFTGAAVSGSFSVTSSTGSVALTLANDVTTEGTESFQLEVRTDSTSGTIIGTSTTVTISDTSVPGYTVVSGTKAPVFGVNGASPHPPTGWTSQFDSSTDDASLQIPTLPFNFYIDNTAFTAVYIGSNSYITFGSGSNVYSGLSASNPGIPKMMFGAADNSYQRISTFVSGTDYVRVRYEGNGSTSGTAGSPGIVAEITLFNPSKFSGNNVIEMLVGVHNRTGGVSNISNVSTAYATYTISANQSYVFVGNSTGTSWVVNTGTYVSGAGY